ncbi:MAG: 4-hydroxybenzoate octaprenyltransferase [Gammaproteobacteria bacterium]|nr:MAG: 4-hydroxybenzoate octaprenyltransferase [Gammaproteobacteria bacterium]
MKSEADNKQSLKNTMLRAWMFVFSAIRALVSKDVEKTRTHWPRVRKRAQLYAQLMRLDRPIGILLLGWPTLWALWIAAEGTPDLWVLMVFILGIVIMRSAGCVINDFADRKFDPHVERTRARPIASGKVSPNEALVVFIALCLIALLLVLSLNRLTILMSIGALLTATAYPFAKRYTYMPQVVLGIAFAWAVPMAFAAQAGHIPRTGWLLSIVVVLWAMAYDTMYAMVDQEDDRQIGVKSTAMLFGDMDIYIIAMLQTAVIAGLLMVGNQLDMQRYYYIGVLIAVLLALYQQYLIRDRVPAMCFKAFVNSQWIGAAIFAGIVSNYLFMGAE